MTDLDDLADDLADDAQIDLADDTQVALRILGVYTGRRRLNGSTTTGMIEEFLRSLEGAPLSQERGIWPMTLSHTEAAYPEGHSIGDPVDHGHPANSPTEGIGMAPYPAADRIRGIRADLITLIDTQEMSSEIAAVVANGFGPIPEPAVRNQLISRNPLADVDSSLIEQVMGAYTLARNRNKVVDTDLMTDIIQAVQPLLNMARRSTRAVNRSFVEHLGSHVEANPSPVANAVDEIRNLSLFARARGATSLGAVLGAPILSTDEEMANDRGVTISWILAIRALGIEYQSRNSAPALQEAMTTWERSLDL
jgi:hypothetical protein